MNKQTKTIVVVVLAVVVIGGLYYGVNRWRQQRLANQILKEVYGVGNVGLLGKLTGGGNLSERMAQEMAKEIAKEEVQQKKDEAKEAAKTPGDRYNETEEMATYDANSGALASGVKEIMEKAFDKVKLTSISTGLYGGEGSGMLEFKTARLTTGADLGALGKAFTGKGFQVMQSGITDKNAGIMAGNDNIVYTINFEIGEQIVGVLVMKMN